MKNFKVAVVVPLIRNEINTNNIVEYLGFGYIASYLRSNGISVDIIDAFVENLSCVEVATKLRKGGYNLIGFTIMSSDYFKNLINILGLLGNEVISSTHITIGGYHATFLSEKLLEKDIRIDSLIVGEGEVTFLELAKCLISNGHLSSVDGIIYRDSVNIITNKPRGLMTEEDLDSLPFPARDTLDYIVNERREVQLLSSRGCYGDCGFCAVNAFYKCQKGKKWRGRSAENVVKEIEDIVFRYNIGYLYFADEEFIGPGEKGQTRARQMAKLIIEKKIKIKFCIYCRANSINKDTIKMLKEAGLDRVFIGIEFGVQKLLDFYNKGISVEDNIKALNVLKEIGINISVGYIMFEPLMDIETFRENLRFYVKNIKFTLKVLTRKMAIYYNSDAFNKLEPHIEIKKHLAFNEVYGDHLDYEFKDLKIRFLYRVLVESLQEISPSKSYRKIISVVPIGDRDILIMSWVQQIYSLIDNLADNISNETDLSDSIYMKYKDNFRKKIVEWDSNFLLKISKIEINPI